MNDCGDSNLPMALAANSAVGADLIGSRNATLVGGFNQTATWGWTPLDWCFRLLPGWAAYAAIAWIQRLVAALGCAWLARRVCGAGWLPALVAGCGYSLFCQFSINDSWSGFTYYDSLALPGIPLVLLALGESTRLSGSGKLRASLGLAALAGALYGLCGSYLFELFVLALAFAWIWLVRPETTFRKTLLPLAVFSLAWLAVVLPFATAALQFAGDSHRAGSLETQVPAQAIAGAWSMLRLSWKDNWPFVIALSAGLLVPPWRHPVHVRLVLATILCAIVVLLAKAASITMRDYLGFLQGFQFQRFYLLLPFLTAFAAASAIAKLHADRPRWLSLTGWACGLLLLGWIGHRSWGVQQLIMKTVVDGWSWSLYTDPDLARLRADTRDAEPYRVVTVANHGTSLWHPDMMAVYGFEAADGYVPLYPGRYHDYWGRVISPHLRSDPKLDAYFTNWGNRAYLFGPLAGWPADGIATPLDTLARIDLLSLSNVRYVISPAPLSHPGLTPVLDRDAAAPPKGFRRKFASRVKAMREGHAPRPSLHIYENPAWLPRFYLATEVSIEADADAVLARLETWSPGDPSFRPAILNREDLAGVEPPAAISPDSGAVSILRVSADAIDLSVVSKTPAVLVIGNAHDGQWEARVGDQATPVFPANHAFQGLIVPSGEHRISLRYRGPRHPLIPSTISD